MPPMKVCLNKFSTVSVINFISLLIVNRAEASLVTFVFLSLIAAYI